MDSPRLDGGNGLDRAAETLKEPDYGPIEGRIVRFDQIVP